MSRRSRITDEIGHGGPGIAGGGEAIGGAIALNGELWEAIDTPGVLVQMERLARNIEEMQALANTTGVKLRPHIKTHRSMGIVAEQIHAGACGATAAKLDEAEMLIDGGVASVLLANEIVTPAKIGRAMRLSARAELLIGVDSREGIERLAAAARDAGTVLQVSIEIDSGLERCGVQPGDAAILARLIDAAPALRLAGVFTHGGHAYAARDEAGIVKAANEECDAVIVAADAIRACGIAVDTVSIGSTPTIKYFTGRPGITEIRPGNYVFMDGIQVGLGVAALDQCALTVAVTVISRPSPESAVVDAGSKTFGLDRGAHGTSSVDHFGAVIGPVGHLVRLSEEHGVLAIPADLPLRPGDHLRILPNHACVVANLASEFWLLDGGMVRDRWPIEFARRSW